MTDFEQTASGLLIPTRFAERSELKIPKRNRPDFNEVATTLDGRDITRGYISPMSIQPNSDSILRLRGGGDYRLYEEVLRDDQVISCFGQRRLAVIAKEIGVDPGGDSRIDKKAADFIREVIAHINFDRATNMMLFGVFYGFSVAEALWMRDGSFIALDQLKVRNRRRFGIDGAGRLRLKTFEHPEGELLEGKKFWFFSTGSDNDDEPYGLGLGHWLYWPTWFKRNGLKYWLIFLEKFGQPTAKGAYPVTATQGEKDRLLQALQAVNTDSGIIIPDGMVIELLEAARSGTADYVELYDRMNSAIAKVCVGQTASSQGTPGRLGNDELQGDVRLDLVKADADLIDESFNRSIVRWLTEWNFPTAKPPRVYRKVEPPEDLNEQADRDKKIVDMGYKPTLKHIQETYGGDWEEKQNKQEIPNTLSNQPEFAEQQESVMPGLIKQTASNLAKPTTAWIEQIRELVASAESLDQLRDLLLTHYPNMSLNDYAAALAEAMTATHLAARSTVHDQVNQHG